jgi:hypothetical protein
VSGWDSKSLRWHSNFVIVMLMVGVLASLVLAFAGEFEAAWGTGMSVASSACAAQWQLSRRLAEVAKPTSARSR